MILVRNIKLREFLLSMSNSSSSIAFTWQRPIWSKWFCGNIASCIVNTKSGL